MTQEFAKLNHKECIAEKTYLLIIESSNIAQYGRAGQFVNIRIDSQGSNPLLRRPYTISNVSDSSFEIIVQVVGRGSQLLAEKNCGEMLDIIGPLGNAFRTGGDFDTACLVGGGVGIAPFPFLTRMLISAGKNVETFAGFKSKAQIVTRELNNIHIATDDGSAGFHGNVVELLHHYFDEHSIVKPKIFSCGPMPMLRALTLFTTERGICCEVSLESEMACGVGLCQGCVVERNGNGGKFALVCKEGPNFFSDEIKL